MKIVKGMRCYLALQKVHRGLSTTVRNLIRFGQSRILNDHLFDLMPETDRQLEIIKSIRVYTNGFISSKFTFKKKPKIKPSFDKHDEMSKIAKITV